MQLESIDYGVFAVCIGSGVCSLISRASVSTQDPVGSLDPCVGLFEHAGPLLEAMQRPVACNTPARWLLPMYYSCKSQWWYQRTVNRLVSSVGVHCESEEQLPGRTTVYPCIHALLRIRVSCRCAACNGFAEVLAVVGHAGSSTVAAADNVS